MHMILNKNINATMILQSKLSSLKLLAAYEEDDAEERKDVAPLSDINDLNHVACLLNF